VPVSTDGEKCRASSPEDPVPTYQYACTSCGEELEVFQSFTDPTLTVHEAPGCGGPLRKVFGSVGVVFKGSGFYRTDSRKGDIAPGPSKSEKSESKSDAAAPAKTETSAPAAKSESSAPKKSESKSGGSTAAA
jgi:putative FmdB family regulatory protein